MANKISHVHYYNQCMQRGRIFGIGLCVDAIYNRIDGELLGLFHPTSEDYRWIVWKGHNTGLWGLGRASTPYLFNNEFTTLRQTIVLFMAAMNGEL